MLRALVVASLALTVIGGGCTDKKLVPVSDGAPQAVDDLLEVDADFCTRPAANVDFPVKLVLVVDASGSMQFTDQPGLRVNAIQQLINSLQSQSNVFVSTIAFGSNIYQDPTPTPDNEAVFRPVAEWTPPPFLSLKDVTTDYQGVLSAINQTLILDMTNTPPDTLARTKYVILFFSDGAPNPLCCIQADATFGSMNFPFGCQPEAWEVPDPNTVYCEGLAENIICLQSDALDNFNQNLDSFLDTDNAANVPNGYSVQQSLPDYGNGNGVLQAVSGLKVDANYNRTFQIEQGVRDIIKLGDDFHVGALTFNTALLDDPTLSDVVKSTFELNSCREKALLQDMANIGHGQFRDFSNAQSIDFLSFDFTSLKEEFTLIDAFAINTNALAPGGDPKVVDYRPDSDGDGLDDNVEFQIGTVPFLRDSDSQEVQTQVGQIPVVCDHDVDAYPDGVICHDGFDDGFEHARENIGFDPRLSSLPVQICPEGPADNLIDQFDLDGDGLNGCEEAILGTDPNNPDSDGDTLPDGLEVRLNLDPLIAEGNRDDDFDGTPNLEEIRKGRDASVPDNIREQTSIRYELVETGHTEDGRTCYTSSARGIHLATTVPRLPPQDCAQADLKACKSGFNDVWFYIAEAPNGSAADRNSFRVACVRVQYIKPSFKDPLQGVVHLAENDFMDIQDYANAVLDDPTFDLCTINNRGPVLQ